MIIGLTGKFAAGKGTVAAMLQEHGFRYHSLSDIIREALADEGIPEGRPALIAMGNRLRLEGGAAALAIRLLDRLGDGGDHIVDSIRNPAEVETLRRLPGFHLIGVDADPKLRFQRLRSRDRQGDPTTWEDFVRLEAQETASEDPNAQQLAGTFALSDVVLRNDAGVEALSVSLGRVLSGLRT